VVWSGLLLALVGAALLGLGLAAMSWVLSLVGVGVLVTGAALGLAGGVMYDAVSTAPGKREIRDVVEGRPHPGVAAGDMVRTHRAASGAEATGEMVRRVTAAGSRAPAPPLAPVAGWSLVLMTIVVMASQWSWVARTATGHTTSGRDTVLAVVVGLCGLRLAIAPGRHRAAAGIALLAGLGLLVAGWTAAHDRSFAVATELTFGALTVVAAIAAWGSPWLGSPEVQASRGHASAVRPGSSRVREP
jgi:hypothetical protein